MCYSVYLSTNSKQDLTQENCDLFRFESRSIAESFRSILLHENQWYLGSKSGCSCTFRHLHSVELGFGEPVEWYPEEEDEIAATLLFIRFVRKLIEREHKVDCIDAWHGATEEISMK